MAWFHLFSGATPENLENRGDRLLAAGQWGEAKLAFERALAKLERVDDPPADRIHRLASKIGQALESLAREHRDTALSYMEGGYLREARESLELALEISRDADFRGELTDALARLTEETDAEAPPLGEGKATRAGETVEAADSPATNRRERFRALCNTLPEPVARAYRSYGGDFAEGYLALNDGDFETAAALLARALEAAREADTYIPLELATACLHLGRPAEARDLLEAFRRRHPDVLPACALLCDIYWEEKDFGRAEALLASLPPELAQSRAGLLLKGQTRHRSGDFRAARDFYRECLATHGWDERMARELAEVHESLGERSEALGLYRELMERCRSCRQPVDALIRQRYAELAFAEGQRGDDLLELYLTLAREVPTHAAICFDRIAEIYRVRRNTTESERFRRFARRARGEQGDLPPSAGP